MTDIVLRIVLLATTLAVGFLVVTFVQRRTVPGRTALPSGLVVVIGPDCRWCDRLLAVIGRRALDTEVHVFDHAEAHRMGLTVHSVPTALVITADGTVAMRRSGPSALHDVDALLAHLGPGRKGRRPKPRRFDRTTLGTYCRRPDRNNRLESTRVEDTTV